MQTRARAQGGADPLDRVIQAIVNPFASVASRAVNGASDYVAGVVAAPRMRAQIRALQEEVVAARMYNEQVDRYESEIDSLRKIIDLPPTPGKTRIAADVVDLFPNAITLNVGSADGVGLHQPVVCAEGLVGRVQIVATHTCQVTLLSSPDLVVGASVLRDPPQPGLLHGENPNNLVLELSNPDAPVQIGDSVVTSGFSEMIPRGISIGRVIQVHPDVEFGVHRASVFPSVSVGSLREVFVLK